jgi:hypothetical protein
MRRFRESAGFCIMLITRRSAIGKALAASVAASSVHGQNSTSSAVEEGQQFFLRLLKSNDEAVARMLGGGAAMRGGFGRLGRGEIIAAMIAAYCSPESAHHQSAELIPLLERAASRWIARCGESRFASGYRFCR